MSTTRRKATAVTSATRVILYCRVSTEKQRDEGISLAAQERKLRDYARVFDLDVVDVAVDAGLSGKTLKRPGLAGALARLAAGEADGLVVVALSRLTRSVRDLGTLITEHFQKAALVSLAENIDARSATGRLVLNVLASVCQWEAEAAGERTSAALRHLAAEGRFTGGRVRYGYRVGRGGQLIEVPEETAVMRRIKRLVRAGRSLRAIARQLEKAGVRSRSGRPFGPGQIRRLAAAA